MASSRLMSGVTIVLFVVLVNLILAFVLSGSAQSSSFTDCQDESNTLDDCNNVGKTSFFRALASVSFSGFEGAPAIVNAIWLSVMGLLLTTAILLIVVSFIPTTSA